jgi:hypothetical protein
VAVNAGDDVDQRGFAAAGLADDRDEFAAVYLQLHAPEGREIAGRAVICLDDLPQVDQTLICVALVPDRILTSLALEIDSEHVAASRCAP